ncbi:hypothetical protein SKAU_G00316980 [Synaphobranchus kaupii]|uniref:Uncharacterized protein n=1 Tax=Synaphobranchus kaupii TaxID=118154 RepID=A0A9Q1ET08_SYNKA|nr:hypothetical protein SKAU_G00316980 [Synaphobranchus kaupii]
MSGVRREAGLTWRQTQNLRREKGERMRQFYPPLCFPGGLMSLNAARWAFPTVRHPSTPTTPPTPSPPPGIQGWVLLSEPAGEHKEINEGKDNETTSSLTGLRQFYSPFNKEKECRQNKETDGAHWLQTKRPGDRGSSALSLAGETPRRRSNRPLNMRGEPADPSDQGLKEEQRRAGCVTVECKHKPPSHKLY